MFLEPQKLIDETIENLERLQDLLSEESVQAHPGLPTPHCREATVAIRTLLPRLRAARSEQIGPRMPGVCSDCD